MLWIFIEYLGFVISSINLNRYNKYLQKRRSKSLDLINKSYDTILSMFDLLLPFELYTLIKHLSSYTEKFEGDILNISDQSLYKMVSYLLFLKYNTGNDVEFLMVNNVIEKVKQKLSSYFKSINVDQSLLPQKNVIVKFKPNYLYLTFTYYLINVFRDILFKIYIKYKGFNLINTKYGKIGYKLKGTLIKESTPIVIFPGIHADYKAIINCFSFSDNYNVIVFIQPTFNNHFNLFPEFVAMDEYCSYIHNFLKINNINKIKVIANSYGSIIYNKFINHSIDKETDYNLNVEKQLFIEPLGFGVSNAYTSDLIKRPISYTYDELVLHVPGYLSQNNFSKWLKTLKCFFITIIMHNLSTCYSYYFTELNAMWINKDLWNNDKTTILLSHNDYVNSNEHHIYKEFDKSKCLTKHGLHGTWFIDKSIIEYLK
jgi:hypothetical protein